MQGKATPGEGRGRGNWKKRKLSAPTPHTGAAAGADDSGGDSYEDDEFEDDEDAGPRRGGTAGPVVRSRGFEDVQNMFSASSIQLQGGFGSLGGFGAGAAAGGMAAGQGQGMQQGQGQGKGLGAPAHGGSWLPQPPAAASAGVQQTQPWCAAWDSALCTTVSAALSQAQQTLCLVPDAQMPVPLTALPWQNVAAAVLQSALQGLQGQLSGVAGQLQQARVTAVLTPAR